MTFVQFSMALPVFGLLFDAHYRDLWQLILATLKKKTKQNVPGSTREMIQ